MTVHEIHTKNGANHLMLYLGHIEYQQYTMRGGKVRWANGQKGDGQWTKEGWAVGKRGVVQKKQNPKVGSSCHNKFCEKKSKEQLKTSFLHQVSPSPVNDDLHLRHVLSLSLT